jgi:hypothetical protein
MSAMSRYYLRQPEANRLPSDAAGAAAAALVLQAEPQEQREFLEGSDFTVGFGGLGCPEA